MARLILSLDGTVLAEYNMNKERYTIGRLPDNDIRIDNPAVSGHHSLIINILNDSFLEDLNSTNGTYVNGKLIKKHALQHGDVITAGHHQLRFVEDDEAQQDEFEKTMVIQPSARPVERVRAAVSEAATPGRTPHARQWRTGHQEGQAAGPVRCLCRPRTRADQGADDARPPGCAGGGHHAPRRRLLHRARRLRGLTTTTRWSTAPRSVPRRASCPITT
jgi:pSer/pThr/pTyr-binding forkhead associated (FHA) protein